MDTNVLARLRKSPLMKGLAITAAVSFLHQALAPSVAYAITDGPTQPEVSSFAQVGNNNMVDLFTGDFSYQIPLLNLPGPDGGYPFNLHYNSGIGTEQEASWVGLGWNLSAGAINRDVRGLPDDFSGEVVQQTIDMKPNNTVGVGTGLDVEIVGADKDKGFSGSIARRLTLYYNTYGGFGYTFAPSMSIGSDKTSNINFGIKLDNQEGIGANTSASIKTKINNKERTFLTGLGFSSKKGLHASLGFKYLNDKVNVKHAFGAKTYTPTASPEIHTIHESGQFKIGPVAGAILVDQEVSGFYSKQFVENNNDRPAYGFAHLDAATSHPEALLDFNREKEGAVRKTTPLLPIAHQTYDLYSVNGHGIGLTFRPYRNQIGHVHDPESSSKNGGRDRGFDVGVSPTSAQVGAEITFSYGNSQTGEWRDINEWDTEYDYHYPPDVNNLTPDYERVVYKAIGESTSQSENVMDYIGGNDPVMAKFNRTLTPTPYPTVTYTPQTGTLVVDNSKEYTTNLAAERSGRMARLTNVIPFTNQQLIGQTQELGEYDIHFYTRNTGNFSEDYDPDVSNDNHSLPLDRSVRNDQTDEPTTDITGHHGGFSVQQTNGSRYVYGLPAYNLVKKERLFSVPYYNDDECFSTVDISGQMNNSNDKYDYKIEATDKYWSETTTPAYAYAYLLTSVLGNDYVDLDDVPGPSEGDRGYWVKFNYVRTSDDYLWRAPFSGANYDRGKTYTPEDDRGSFDCGRKEVFHIATAETRTHIAIFDISPRTDGFAAAEEYNHADAIDQSNPGWQLNKIRLYTKAEYLNPNGSFNNDAVPLQTTYFQYEIDPLQQLAQDVSNGLNSGNGKLTLRKVWTEYQNSQRGSNNAYTFTYGGVDKTYTNWNMDRWGNYKKGTEVCKNRKFPYVEQFDADANDYAGKRDFKEDRDKDAAAWSLTKIDLPSGGSIEVEYEADDYGYVQHKAATQMFRIHGLDLGTGVCSSGDVVYHKNSWNASNTTQRRIYFDLEEPIPVTTDLAAYKSVFYDKYLKPLKVGSEHQLYFKISSNLRDDYYEDIKGYANILTNATDYYGVFSDPTNQLDCRTSLQLTSSGSPVMCYTKGYITLDLPKVDDQTVDYHPFAFAGWQFMRTSAAKILTAQGNLNQQVGSPQASTEQKVKNFASWIPELMKIFTGYRTYAFNRSFADKIDLSKSVIRLGTPDRIKYGGNTRVKKLTLNDNWSQQTGTYSTLYDYTTTEMIGGVEQTISSGVAQYEPLLGGEENPFRTAVRYTQNIPFKTDNDLFAETPINESLFPAPVVGYSKVTVRSEATQSQMDAGNGQGTTGITVSEFYTAKDFPVITRKTSPDIRPFNLPFPIPLVGQITTNNLTATQGFVIELNDMHGKPKSVSNYGIDVNGVALEEANSSMHYHYQSEPVLMENDVVAQKVVSSVNVVEQQVDNSVSPTAYHPVIEQRLLGVEHEFCTDQRSSQSFSYSGGGSANLNIEGGVITIPSFWPNYSAAFTNLHLAVTNKMIRRSGILEKVEATDGQSVVTTQHEYYDKLTGQPVVTSIQNNFNNPVYTFNHQGYWEYEGMGAAAQNQNMRFFGTITNQDADQRFGLHSSQNRFGGNLSLNDLGTYLHEGDEYLLYTPASGSNPPLSAGKATLVEHNGTLTFHSATNLSPASQYLFLLVRSGKRNLLAPSVGAFSSLQNPVTQWGFETGPNPLQSALEQEFTDFLSAIVTNGQLPVFNFVTATMPSLFTPFPLVEEYISSIEILIEDGTHNRCIPCLEQEGYSLRIVLNDANKTEVYCPCFVRRFDDQGTALSIASFNSPGNGVIETVFSNDPENSTSCACIGFAAGDYAAAIVPDVLQTSAATFSQHWPTSQVSANPYATGEKGIWRAKESYYYRDGRFQNDHLLASTFNTNYNPVSDTKEESQLATDGVFDGKPGTNGLDKLYYPFVWNPSVTQPRSDQWLPVSTVMEYNDQGYEIEERDILGNYSAARYGYGQTLPVAVAANARESEIFFESWDDPYSNFDNYVVSGFASAVAEGKKGHTGAKSMRISTAAAHDLPLTPNGQKELVLSAWVSRYAPPGEVSLHHDFASSGLSVNITPRDAAGNNLSATLSAQPTGAVIEGWQRIELTFTVPASTTELRVFWEAGANAGPNATDQYVYVDDLRIFPKLGNLQSYVYDPSTFRLSATLDQNNFARYYYYDEEGNLFLVKTETVEGIMTLQVTNTYQDEQP